MQSWNHFLLTTLATPALAPPREIRETRLTRDSRAPCQDISSNGTRVAAPGETLFFFFHRRPQKSAGVAASKCRSSLGNRAQAPNEAERGGIATAARALGKGVPRAAAPRRICVSFMRERAPTTLSASAAGIVSDIRSQTLPLFMLTSLSLANRAKCYGYETTDTKTGRMLRYAETPPNQLVFTRAVSVRMHEHNEH